jgi:hypothetical protein
MIGNLPPGTTQIRSIGLEKRSFSEKAPCALYVATSGSCGEFLMLKHLALSLFAIKFSLSTDPKKRCYFLIINGHF